MRDRTLTSRAGTAKPARPGRGAILFNARGDSPARPHTPPPQVGAKNYYPAGGPPPPRPGGGHTAYTARTDLIACPPIGWTARPGRGALLFDARVTPVGVHLHDDSPARPC